MYGDFYGGLIETEDGKDRYPDRINTQLIDPINIR
jgi:hypothetical protein